MIRWRNGYISQSVKNHKTQCHSWSKIMRLNAIPLNNWWGASKLHKKMPQKVFHHNIKALGCF